jgi:chaperonin cofactor prefoldin
MASSKNKLTEEQLNEGLFNSILKNIFANKTRKVLKLVADVPDIKQAVKDLEKSKEKLRVSIKNAEKSRKSIQKKYNI